MRRQRKPVPGVDAKLLIKDAAKLLPQPSRRLFMRGAASLGALAVLIFMAIYYNGAGLLADFGLTLNILMLVCVMAALQATLTLPGIAGIVLTLGMSVDANVLVNERMREELRAGKSPREAVKVGYERAWSAIRDSNISTFVAGLILFLTTLAVTTIARSTVRRSGARAR